MKESADSEHLVELLRKRLAGALVELDTCRALLRAHEIPYSSEFGANFDDHADLLKVSVEVPEAPDAEQHESRHEQPETSNRGPEPPSLVRAVPGSVRERELEEELSTAKALLMLNNVTLSMDFDSDPLDASPGVKLRGSPHLIQLLITLNQKVSLLKQQYMLLRGDMLYLSHEMSVCRHWVLQSFRMAMQHQAQEHRSLQTRFERLSKVLN